MALNEQTRERIESYIQGNDIVLFMKGNRSMPQCGFSGKVVQILDSLVQDYKTVDVLADADVREGIKEYSAWPTIPQLYLKGEFVGGCDVITELYATGELHESSSAWRCRSARFHPAHLRRGSGAHPRVHGSRTGQGAEALGRRALSGLARLGAAPGARGGSRVQRHPRADGPRRRRTGRRLDDRLVESPTGRGVQDRQPERARRT
jgi:Grx4 family monothiol glutaredoxin